YGALVGDGSSAGVPSLNMYTPGWNVHCNAIGTAAASAYPSDNDPMTIANWIANFISVSAANYGLVSYSAERAAATDGTDVGVNFPALNAALNSAAKP